MHLSVAVSKIGKWAVSQSGDTLEMIERPRGGLSLVLADGQSSGPGAKATSIRVVRKVITELAEGVRDGAAARAANDMLHAHRGGRVSATLVILSIEADSQLLVITRCGNSAVYLRYPEREVEALETDVPSLGFYRYARPHVERVNLEPGLLIVACSDGLLHAGQRSGERMDVCAAIEEIWQTSTSARSVAEGLLNQAVELDSGRPRDDISVVALHLKTGASKGPRHLQVEMPVPDR
jgi:serine phosphatase RsbU (regulator of sigma subunit)